MKKWRIWLKRTAWVAMGLVLMSGSAGISALAANNSGTENAGNNTPAANYDGTTTITGFADLGALANQELEDGEPQFPETLEINAITVKKDGTEVPGAARAVFNVAIPHITEAGSGTKEISGWSWQIDAARSSSGTFDSSKAGTYVYQAVKPVTDGDNNLLRIKEGVALPTIMVKVKGGAPLADQNLSTFSNSVTAYADGNNPDDPFDQNPVGSASKELQGLTIVTEPGASAIIGSSNYIVLETPGTYYITGTWKDPALNKTAVTPIITLGSNDPNSVGVYNVVLSGITVDITGGSAQDSAYTSVFFLKSSSSTLNLTTIPQKGAINLMCREDNYQEIIKCTGKLNIVTAAKMNLTGRLTNEGDMVIQEGSELYVKGSIRNKSNMTITDSAKVECTTFNNEGTLIVNKPSEDLSKPTILTVTGRLTNTGTMKLDEGELNPDDPAHPGEPKGKIENRGTLELTNKSTAKASDFDNRGGTLLVSGASTALNVSGELINSGNLNVTDFGKALVGRFSNDQPGKIILDEKGKMEITHTGSKSISSGTIEIKAGSSITRTSGIAEVTLENTGILQIGNDECLGTGDTAVYPTRDPDVDTAKFIINGLVSGMIEKVRDLELQYTGKSQTDEVDGINSENGAFKLKERFEVNKCMFDVAVSVKLGEITLERPYREAVSGTAWYPMIKSAGEVASGDDKYRNKDSAIVSEVKDPGKYKLTYVNVADETQKCTTDTFTMSEWSMWITTSGNEGSTVYDYYDTIKGDVHIAIFSEGRANSNIQQSLTRGNVKLYYDTWEKLSPNDASREIIALEDFDNIQLDADGCATVSFEIQTRAISKKQYLYPKDAPYRLIAVYEDFSGRTPYNDSKDEHPVLKDYNAKQGSAIRTKLTDWFEDMELTVNKADIDFTWNYYGTPPTYEAKELLNPVLGEEVKLYPDPDDPELVSIKWYKGSVAQMDRLVQTKDPFTLADTQDKINENYLVNWEYQEWEDAGKPTDVKCRPNGTYPPKNAGTYVIEVTVNETDETKQSVGYYKVTINQRPVRVRAKSLRKIYGQEEPDWSAPENYIVEDLAGGGNAGLLGNDKLEGGMKRDGGEDYNGSGYTIRSGTLGSENYIITDFVFGTLWIDPRPLEWDINKLAAVKTDEGFSVVGGLDTSYQATETDDEIEDYYRADDVSLKYTSLELDGDSGKVTVNGAELTGRDKDNYSLPTERTIPLDVLRNYTLVVKSGIDSETPDKIKDMVAGLDTTDKIKGAMEGAVVDQGASQKNTSVYDIILLDEKGNSVENDSSFPWGGITVTLPYPVGTSKTTHSFVAAHMFTKEINANGSVNKAGFIEKPVAVAVDDGIRFQVTSLSPISIGWTTANIYNPDNPGTSNGNNSNNNNGTNGNGSGTNGSGTNGNGTNGTNNGTNSGTNGTNNGTNGTNNNNNSSTTKNGSTTTRTTGVKTGDTAQIAFYSIATLIACLLLILIIFLIKAQFRKKE